MRPDFAELGKPLRIDPGHQVPELLEPFCGDKVERPDEPFPGSPVGRAGPDKIGDRGPLVRGCLLGFVPFHGLEPLRAIDKVDLALRTLPYLFYHVQGCSEQFCTKFLADCKRHGYHSSEAETGVSFSGPGMRCCDASGCIQAQTSVMSSPLATDE